MTHNLHQICPGFLPDPSARARYADRGLGLLNQKKGGSFASVSRGVVSEHSARILYRGMLPTVAREALWVGSYLGLVPVLQDELGKIEPLADSPYTVWALAASSAGLIGGTLTHPLDSIKTRMQVRH